MSRIHETFHDWFLLPLTCSEGVLQKPEPLVMEFNTHMRVRTHTNTHTPLAKEKLEEDPGEGGAVAGPTAAT